MLRAVAEKLSEDQSSALPAGESREGLGHDLPVIGGRELVDSRGQREGPPNGERGPPGAPPESVEGGPVQISRWILHVADAIPPLEQAEERVLHHLLGLMAVAGDQAEAAEQRRALGFEEVLEALRLAHHLRDRDPGARHEPERSRHPVEEAVKRPSRLVFVGLFFGGRATGPTS